MQVIFNVQLSYRSAELPYRQDDTNPDTPSSNTYANCVDQ